MWLEGTDCGQGPSGGRGRRTTGATSAPTPLVLSFPFACSGPPCECHRLGPPCGHHRSEPGPRVGVTGQDRAPCEHHGSGPPAGPLSWPCPVLPSAGHDRGLQLSQSGHHGEVLTPEPPAPCPPPAPDTTDTGRFSALQTSIKRRPPGIGAAGPLSLQCARPWGPRPPPTTRRGLGAWDRPSPVACTQHRCPVCAGGQGHHHAPSSSLARVLPKRALHQGKAGRPLAGLPDPESATEGSARGTALLQGRSRPAPCPHEIQPAKHALSGLVAPHGPPGPTCGHPPAEDAAEAGRSPVRGRWPASVQLPAFLPK